MADSGCVSLERGLTTYVGSWSLVVEFFFVRMAKG